MERCFSRQKRLKAADKLVGRVVEPTNGKQYVLNLNRSLL